MPRFIFKRGNDRCYFIATGGCRVEASLIAVGHVIHGVSLCIWNFCAKCHSYRLEIITKE